MEPSASTPSKKLDYERELKELFGPRAGPPAIVDVHELSFLMVDGMGDPNTSRNYREAVEALFALSYRVKFAVKRGLEEEIATGRHEAAAGPLRRRPCGTGSPHGPYSAERPTIERLHAFIAEAGYRPRGKHHEIYLSDPSRAEPAKLKTIVRQPIAAAS